MWIHITVQLKGWCEKENHHIRSCIAVLSWLQENGMEMKHYDLALSFQIKEQKCQECTSGVNYRKLKADS